jgi:hypothetical protein
MLVRASVVPSSPILVTLMEAIRSSETSVLTRATWDNIPEDTILPDVGLTAAKFQPLILWSLSQALRTFEWFGRYIWEWLEPQEQNTPPPPFGYSFSKTRFVRD